MSNQQKFTATFTVNRDHYGRVTGCDWTLSKHNPRDTTDVETIDAGEAESLAAASYKIENLLRNL